MWNYGQLFIFVKNFGEYYYKYNYWYNEQNSQIRKHSLKSLLCSRICYSSLGHCNNNSKSLIYIKWPRCNCKCVRICRFFNCTVGICFFIVTCITAGICDLPWKIHNRLYVLYRYFPSITSYIQI